MLASPLYSSDSASICIGALFAYYFINKPLTASEKGAVGNEKVQFAANSPSKKLDIHWDSFGASGRV